MNGDQQSDLSASLILLLDAFSQASVHNIVGFAENKCEWRYNHMVRFFFMLSLVVCFRAVNFLYALLDQAVVAKQPKPDSSALQA